MERRTYSRTPSVTLALFGLFAGFIAALFFTFAAAPEAHADCSGSACGGDVQPDPGSGGDGCLVTGWTMVTDYTKIQTGGGAVGNQCSDPTEFGKTLPEALKSGSVNVDGCVDQNSQLIALLYVHDPSGAWATSNLSGPLFTKSQFQDPASLWRQDWTDNPAQHSDSVIQTRKYLEQRIDAIPDSAFKNLNVYYSPATVRLALKAAISADDHNVVVCVWNKTGCKPGSCGGTDYRCDYLSGWADNLHALDPATKFASPEAADASCYVRCPSTTQDHAGLPIPTGYAANPGDYCWHGTTAQGQWETTQTNADSVTEPYAWTTTVFDANDPNGTGSVTPGEATFTPVTSDPAYSPFAAFWNAHCTVAAGCDFQGLSNESGEYQAFLTAMKQAATADASAKHAQVNALDDAHKRAFAQGRVLTVREMTTYATVDMKAWRYQWYARTCTNHYNLDGSVSYIDCPAWVYTPSQNADRHTWDQSDRVAASMPRATQAWQAVTNHCNSTDFNAVTNTAKTALKDNGTDGLIDSLDGTHYYSASAVSKVYTDMTQLPWGAISGNQTSKANFYDRLCYYAGKEVDPTTGKDQTKTPVPDWSFFRDGELHTLQDTTGRSPYFVPNVAGETRTIPNPNPDPGPEPIAPTVVPAPGAEPTAVTKPPAEPLAPTPVAPPGADSGTVWTANTYSWSQCGGANATVSDVDFGPYVGSTYGDTGQMAYGVIWSNINCHNNTSYTWGITLPADKDIYWTLWSSNLSRRGYGSFHTGHSADWNTANANYNAYVSSYNTWKATDDAWQAKNTAYQNYLKQEAAWQASKALYSKYLSDYAAWQTADAAWKTAWAAFQAPATTVGVNAVDNGSAATPIATLLTRDPNGTPTTALMNVVGVGGSSASGPAFSTDGSNVATPGTQAQFTAGGAFTSSVSSIVPGGWKQLAARSAWASTKGNPEVLTFAWYFNPTVTDRAPVANIGFAAPGGSVTWTTGTISTNVIGRVEASNSSLTTPSDGKLTTAQARVFANSGTGSTDGLDVPLPYGAAKNGTGQWTAEPSKADEHYWSVQFVRATTS